MTTQIKVLLHLLKEKIQIVFAVVGAFLMPVQPLLLLIGAMILIDTLTGLWKSKKTGVPVTSKKLSRVISKMLLYQICIITFFILDKYLLGEFISLLTSIPLFLTKVSAIILATIELVSINENFKAVTGISMWTQLKLILGRAAEVKDDLKKIGDFKEDKKTDDPEEIKPGEEDSV
jgi:hypothetical protein